MFFASNYAEQHQAEELFTPVFADAHAVQGVFRLVRYGGDTAQIDIAVTLYNGDPYPTGKAV